MLRDCNTYPISQLADKKYQCGCGQEHVIFTREIIFEEAPVPKLCESISKHIGAGIKIGMVLEKAVFDELGYSLEKQLNRAGFRIVPHIIESICPSVSEADKIVSGLDEDVKAIMAVGGTETADLCKYAGERAQLPVIIYGACLDTQGYLSASSVLKLDGLWEIFSVRPAGIFAFDCKACSDSASSEIAAAIGSIAAKNIALFDWHFSHKMTGEKYCETIAELCECEIDACFSACNGAIRGDLSDIIKIAESGVRLSWLMQAHKNTRLCCGGETHAAHVLDMLFSYEQRQKRSAGENVFLCANLLSGFYSGELKTGGRDFLPPPDNTVRLSAITECLGISEVAALTKMHPLQSDADTKLAEYKFNEYLPEFRAELKKRSESLSRFLKAFKRSYPDCGYWMKHYLDINDTSLIIALAPDIREKYSFLLYLKQVGALEKLITVF